eukprot:5958187-Prymnesium_polylepis.1
MLRAAILSVCLVFAQGDGCGRLTRLTDLWQPARFSGCSELPLDSCGSFYSSADDGITGHRCEVAGEECVAGQQCGQAEPFGQCIMSFAHNDRTDGKFGCCAKIPLPFGEDWRSQSERSGYVGFDYDIGWLIRDWFEVYADYYPSRLCAALMKATDSPRFLWNELGMDLSGVPLQPAKTLFDTYFNFDWSSVEGFDEDFPVTPRRQIQSVFEWDRNLDATQTSSLPRVAVCRVLCVVIAGVVLTSRYCRLARSEEAYRHQRKPSSSEATSLYTRLRDDGFCARNRPRLKFGGI